MQKYHWLGLFALLTLVLAGAAIGRIAQVAQRRRNVSHRAGYCADRLVRRSARPSPGGLPMIYWLFTDGRDGPSVGCCIPLLCLAPDPTADHSDDDGRGYPPHQRRTREAVRLATRDADRHLCRDPADDHDALPDPSGGSGGAARTLERQRGDRAAGRCAARHQHDAPVPVRRDAGVHR